MWETIRQPLIEMRIDEVIRLVKLLDISADRLEMIVQKIRTLNLNGLVLATCDFSELQQTVKVCSSFEQSL